jgi:hypothetical protein
MSHQSTRGAWNSHVTSTSATGARTVHVRCSFWPSTIIRVHLPTQMTTGIRRVLFPRLEKLYLSSTFKAHSTTNGWDILQTYKTDDTYFDNPTTKRLLLRYVIKQMLGSSDTRLISHLSIWREGVDVIENVPHSKPTSCRVCCRKRWLFLRIYRTSAIKKQA